MIPNRNQLWGRVVAEELARGGVREVCLSPGSRSTPLALAVHEQKALRVTTHLDERSAAYFALGIAKGTGRPAVLICTSGTAAANYLPAVVEASQSNIPLLVLTADRPPQLHDVGANQSIDQQHLYGPYARWFVDAGPPQPNPARVRHLRALIGRAVARASGRNKGPVHLNFPFEEPLEPTPVKGDVPLDWHQGDEDARRGRDPDPFLETDLGRVQPHEAFVQRVAKLVEREPSGIIVVGPRPFEPSFAKALVELSTKIGYPILADPLSGLRFAHPETCRAYDAWLASATRRDQLRVGAILRFGATPTSKNLLTYLKESSGASQVLVDETSGLGEETNRAGWATSCDPEALVQALLDAVRRRSTPALATQVQSLEQRTRSHLAAACAKRPFEGAILQHILAALPAGTNVFVSNSLPVRDVDRFGTTTNHIEVFGNRGASGIDGILSTALGIAHGRGKRIVALVGDVAFLHDLSALVARKRLNLALDVVVLDNDGGGIFEFLPISRTEPPFTELFVTPHGMSIGSIGKALGLEVVELTAEKALSQTWAFGSKTQRSRLVVVKTDRKENVRHRRELEASLDAELARAPEASARAR